MQKLTNIILILLAFTMPCFAEDAAEHWAYQPIVRPAVPETSADRAIDHFIREQLSKHRISPAAPASKTDLIRRIYIDMLGVPPQPAEIESFIQDSRPDAYGHLVERVLADARYGQRWARHWLDVVRYAESDGYKSDVYRPHAWRFRDYVIDSFNSDKPFDRFVQEQLAGDEMFADDPQALVATGYYRAAPYEDNQSDVESQWELVLTELTDTTAEVFLGMSMACARCHDHKFDPITQREYFRLRAFFEAVRFDDDLKLATRDKLQQFSAESSRWESATADLRKQIAAIDAPYLARKRRESEARYPKSLKAMLAKSASDRTPREQQLSHFAEIQTAYRSRDFQGLLSKDQLVRRKELEKQMRREFDELKPAPLPPVLGVRDMGSSAPATRLPETGEVVRPGTPAVLGSLDIQIAGGEHTTGRRSALARWITSPANPLPARVMVNRIWQGHFSIGLIDTPNDFGKLGSLPSHPKLLDWLAAEFIESGWSIKHIHRLILLSETYQQSARRHTPAAAAGVDPQNRLLWRFRTRRMEGDVIRDAMLSVSGELDAQSAGPSGEQKSNRRSIYIKHLRNQHHAVLAAFDCPINFDSTPNRPTTTTAPQALLLLNNDWVLGRAKAFAKRLTAAHATDLDARIAAAYRYAFGRTPTKVEIEAANSFLSRQAEQAGGDADAAWIDFCHALLNANEFLYIELNAMMRTYANSKQPMLRRQMLAAGTAGFGSLALSALLAGDAVAATAQSPLAAKRPHFPRKARSVIFLFMEGGPSQMDSFDPKPALQKFAGKAVPQSLREGLVTAMGEVDSPVLASKRKWRQHGQSGLWVSDWCPHVAQCVDDITVIRSCTTDGINHSNGLASMNTGAVVGGRPSIGSWLTYGLGTENENLPAYVVMQDTKDYVVNGSRNWSAGFMPAVYQGTLLSQGTEPVANLRPPKGMSSDRLRGKLSFIDQLNQRYAANAADESELDARIRSYELAFRMQTHAPEAVDIAAEPEHIREMYGLNNKTTQSFGRNCLLARRLVERGVRFVQCYSGSGSKWDAHSKIEDNHTARFAETDQPVAALLKDLKQRGLFEQTLVIWGGEFGRTPMSEKGDGRDHNPTGFTMWMAGGGIPGGRTLGSTDDFGLHATEDPVHVHDLHASILWLMGIDHTKLIYHHTGRPERIDANEGKVYRKLLHG